MKKLHVGSNNRKCSNTCCRRSTFILLTSTAKLIRTSSSVLDKRSSATRNTTFPSSSTPSLESTNQSHCRCYFLLFLRVRPSCKLCFHVVRPCVRACVLGRRRSMPGLPSVDFCSLSQNLYSLSRYRCLLIFFMHAVLFTDSRL